MEKKEVVKESKEESKKESKEESKEVSDLVVKTLLLDPFSVIVKFAVLRYKPIGTKINISNNCILIQEVGIFQSFVRFFQNNNKDDLYLLYNPIEMACEHYLSDKIVDSAPNIIDLFESALLGIKNVIETYKSSPMIVLCLNYYTNIISNYLGDTYNEELFICDKMTPHYKQAILDKMSSRWTTDKIQLVLELNDFLNKNEKSEDSVNCLELFMKGMDKETQEIILASV